MQQFLAFSENTIANIHNFFGLNVWGQIIMRLGFFRFLSFALKMCYFDLNVSPKKEKKSKLLVSSSKMLVDSSKMLVDEQNVSQ